MLNNKLKVKIPKKFKKQLIARFSVSNAEQIGNRYEINVSCPLCKAYGDSYTCTDCPFYKFQITLASGCRQWISKISNMKIYYNVIFGSRSIWWYLQDNKQARKLLKKLKTQAKKYIEWV